LMIGLTNKKSGHGPPFQQRRPPPIRQPQQNLQKERYTTL
jgi:hypothetical protein